MSASEEVVHHISTTKPISKKEYLCVDCGKVIPKGNKHIKNIFKIGKDEKIRWTRSHIECPSWPE